MSWAAIVALWTGAGHADTVQTAITFEESWFMDFMDGVCVRKASRRILHIHHSRVSPCRRGLGVAHFRTKCGPCSPRRLSAPVSTYWHMRTQIVSQTPNGRRYMRPGISGCFALHIGKEYARAARTGRSPGAAADASSESMPAAARHRRLSPRYAPLPPAGVLPCHIIEHYQPCARPVRELQCLHSCASRCALSRAAAVGLPRRGRRVGSTLPNAGPRSGFRSCSRQAPERPIPARSVP